MTGKELILYILQNNLEDTVVFGDEFFSAFMTVPQAAVKFEVGEATIRAWNSCGMLTGFKFGDTLYFRKDTVDPRVALALYTTRNGV